MEEFILTKRKDGREEKKNKIKKYLTERVMPLLSPLQISILKNQP